MNQSTTSTEEEVVSAKMVMFNFSLILLGFSVICFITSSILNSGTGKTQYLTANSRGGEIGSITVKEENTIYGIKISQRLIPNSWDYVYLNIEDNNDNVLYTIGKELWSETGYDSDGAWSAQETTFDNKVTFQEKGTYYLNLETETNSSESLLGDISIAMTKITASGIPHKAVGIVALIAGLILLEVSKRVFSKILTAIFSE